MSELAFLATHVPATPGFMVVTPMRDQSGELASEFCLMPIVAWLVESTPVVQPGGFEKFHSYVTPVTPEGAPDNPYAIWCPMSKQYVIEHEGSFDRPEELLAYFKELETK